ncbi:MAG: protein translocase subunit SecD [SAR202 cluster bacterium]|nr:protein translocase subunit SecD [SAR202 cluster bacterium]
MRGRTTRITVLIVLIMALAVASLAFRGIHIDVPVLPKVDREGTGPLGLKLGLDLRGGGNLVYQADTGTRLVVTFTDAHEAKAVTEALAGAGLTGADVQPQGSSNLFRIKTVLLDSAKRQEVRDALTEKVGTLESVAPTDITNPTPDQMEGALSIISRRVNLFGTEEPIIQRFGDDRIIVQLPGATGSQTEVEFSQAATEAAVRSALASVSLEGARIEVRSDRSYRIRTTTLDQAKRDGLRQALQDQVAPVSSYKVTSAIDNAKSLIGQTARLEFKERTCTDLSCIQFTDTDLGLTGDDLDNAYTATSSTTGEWVVNIQFNSRGAEIFSDLTRRIVNVNTKRIAVFLDDQELIAPVARGWIRDGRSEITGGFTRESARTLAVQLESGRLPVPLKLVQESEVDSLLGAASLRSSLIAGLVGLGLVMAFMVVYYRAAGVVASIALAFYTILLLAIFKLVPVTLTLPGIAGFILSIGMAVDANVLIFERMKEELRIGRTLSSSMEVAFSRAWPAIRDGNVTIFISCGILLWFGSRLGGELVTGFALTLFIGTVISVFTAVTVSRNLLQLLARAGLSRHASLFTPEGIRRPAAAPAGR